jgi:hypothetical protein
VAVQFFLHAADHGRCGKRLATLDTSERLDLPQHSRHVSGGTVPEEPGLQPDSLFRTDRQAKAALMAARLDQGESKNVTAGDQSTGRAGADAGHAQTAGLPDGDGPERSAGRQRHDRRRGNVVFGKMFRGQANQRPFIVVKGKGGG